MDSAAASSLVVSPASDDRFWDGLRNRVDTILEDRRLVASAASTCAVASGRPKRLREDSLMLVRGLDSVAASLAQLSDTLTAAQKGVNALATCSSQARERESGEEEPEPKRHCGGASTLDAQKVADQALGNADAKPNGDVVLASAEVAQSTNLKRARSLAVSMAGRAANLARELTTIKSELRFMQERCGLLEEENKRLRDGYDGGGAAAPEEDDLVRLQLEALLAEKSRLAQENANLARENQSLVQLVEYHQLTAQEEEEELEDHLLTASYEEAIMQGMRLDFSSPLGKFDGEFDGVPATPGSKLGVPDE
ncbi:uncharacterized protein LOC123424514 [Hordeum vulgare subsp. vulgare]|uniref:Uncharacterized protein n=1 Tax=Hordeum vulgare subsp. vulgare TaxID=112509 RepID=A0A8I6WN23_HORVV|nr:uncharacterized protein LOC123424514 [Hordeum vulgare subsp. vulgare]